MSPRLKASTYSSTTLLLSSSDIESSRASSVEAETRRALGGARLHAARAASGLKGEENNKGKPPAFQRKIKRGARLHVSVLFNLPMRLYNARARLGTDAGPQTGAPFPASPKRTANARARVRGTRQLLGAEVQSFPRPPWLRYGVAALCVVFATLLRLWLRPALGDHFPFITYFIAVVF